MNALYAAKFFDGNSSKPVQVYVEWHSWGFEIIEQQNPDKKTPWLREKVEIIEYHKSIITLRYGNQFPKAQLDVTDVDFIARFYREFKQKPIKKLNLKSSGFVLGMLLLIICLGWLTYVFVLPAVADYGTSIFPKEYEIGLGNEIKQQLLLDEKIDTLASNNLNHFFTQLHVNSTYPVSITVIQSETVNAFALPGGQMVVYSGIINKINSSDQLAALLLHEYAHIEYRHSTRNLFRNLAGYLFLSIIFSDVNGITGVLVENANQLRNLSYSRALEQEADNKAMQVLKLNQIGLTGMIELFNILKKESHGIEVNELLSTHPDIDERIKEVNTFKQENPYSVHNNQKLISIFSVLKSNL